MRRLSVAVLTACVFLAGAVPCLAQGGVAWREVLKGIERDLDRRAEEVEAIRAELPNIMAKAQQSLARMDNKLTQVSILRGVAGRTPWALRTLVAHTSGIRRDFELSGHYLDLARAHLSRIKEDNATLKEIRRKGPENEYNDETIAALAPATAKLKAIKKDVDEIKSEVDAQIGQFAQFRQNLDSLRGEFRTDYIRVLTEHYFRRTHPPLDGYGIALLKNQAGAWREDYPRFLLPVLAWTEWTELALFGLPAWLLLYFAGAGAARRMGVSQERRVRLGWPLLSFGVSLYLVTLEVPYTASHMLNLALVSVAAWGAVLLVRHRQAGNQLDFLLLLYVAGCLAQAADIPAEMLCVGGAPLLALAAWNRWRAGARGTGAALAALSLAALSGFGPQAVVLAQAWFMFTLTRAAAGSLKAWLQELGGIWTGYVYPLAVTVLYVTYLSWVLIFMGGPGFLDYVFALEVSLGPVKVSLDAVAVMALMFFAARLMLAWVPAGLDRATFSGKALDQALAHTLSTLLSYVTWLTFLLAVLHILGLPLTGLTWIASGLSVGVGFGLKDIINNFVSGLIILFGGSIKKGDVVQTGKTLGEVVAVSVRNTTVRTLDNSMVIIPNSSFLKGEIINWSYQDKRIRLTIPVSVVPGTKIKKVRKILEQAALANELVLRDPEPSVMLRQFGKMGLDFELYVWIADFRDKYRVESELAADIDQLLQENKITVAFQSAKVKYKPKGSEEAQREAAREELRAKRHAVFALVRPLRRVHLRAKWGMAAQAPVKDES
ncbi:mechanosensitive ion channel domain-containing protein [Fundidesulfovibrio terrae]|uniref:mechanosensitive ion channel domain-containing protein n=1 Tax=Fundidesulfovibrio terrae TaxID=2922866 RepID=UPI001FAF41EF|nr:mechanosensitive ion channel domain-containing protein [Fundidesulfovibrio terrae]